MAELQIRRGNRNNPKILYFFSYNTRVFSFQNNAKNLDPSYKMDLDLRYCLGKGKVRITAKFCMTDLVVWGHPREGENPRLIAE